MLKIKYQHPKLYIVASRDYLDQWVLTPTNETASSQFDPMCVYSEVSSVGLTSEEVCTRSLKTASELKWN